MRPEVRKAIYGRECVDAINDFTCEIKKGIHLEPENALQKTIPQQVSKQMQPVRTFMDNFQSIPILGAILFKAT